MQFEGKSLLIRADASTQIGTGHVMRCLALAQAWQSDGGHAFFAMSMESPALQARLQSEGIEVIHLPAQPGSADDAVQTVDLAQRMGATWVVADGYHFGAEYQRIIKGAGQRLLFIDDNGHADHYCADVVLNQNIHAHEGFYESREPHTRLLLGPRYVLLRREFLGWRRWKREIPEVARKVLVTLGGGDPDNVTLKVIQALQQVKVNGLEAVVVVGGSNPHYEELQSAAQDSRFPIYLESNVVDMPELMAWADVAVSAGGSTCWELAFMGLPALIVVLADNQRLVGEGLDATGVALNSGWYEDVPADRIAETVMWLLTAREVRTEMSQRGQQLVDGEGGQRVVADMLAEASMRARPASGDDIGLLFQWANDPLTRRMSFNSSPISWEGHQQWFERITNTSDTLLVIVELQEKGRWIPIGQVRIDGDGKVSISLSPKYRGRRLAVPALKTAIAYHNRLRRDVLTAYIKPENELSQRIFTQAGFEYAGWAEVSGQPCLEYVYRLPDDGDGKLSGEGDRYVQDS